MTKQELVQLLSQVSEKDGEMVKKLLKREEVRSDKAETFLKERKKKFPYLKGIDERKETDPANWKSDFVAVCECGFCGKEFRRQPCDVHTAQSDGKGCCSECRKTLKKTVKKSASVELKDLREQVVALLAQSKKEANG
jgi:hypothetical protein